MNRRNFLKFLGAASVGATVAYSFPSVIVPNNIILVEPIIPVSKFNLAELNEIVRREIYPRVIRDHFFKDTPFFTYLREKHEEGKVTHSFGEAMQLINANRKDKVIKIYSDIDNYYKELEVEISKRIV